FKDDGYAKNRAALRLPKDSLVKVSDEVGLHPAMSAAGDLLQSKRLAIVKGVGYPTPSRSHADSMAIWRTARLDVQRDQFVPGEASGFGWLGLALAGAPRPYAGAPASVFL